MKRYALIVAGGHGIRLGGEVPKQFLFINGRPVLFHTIEKFQGVADELFLVLPASHFDFWEQLCSENNFKPLVTLVPGGESRTESVRNGLQAIPSPGIVAIHDAVRPLVSKELIHKLFQEAGQFGNAVPVIPIRESLRFRKDLENRAVNREDYVAVQTPQCFDYQTIKSAYRNIHEQFFSDDAGVYEHAGGKIHLVMGETQNIKITFKEDIAIAQALLDATNL